MLDISVKFNSQIDDKTKDIICYIINTYNTHGYECWLVGGTVRDLLLGYKPKDFDFTTNCPLDVTKKIFNHVIPTGEDHGTLTIHIDGENYEVTRYRKDVETDGRRATIAYAETLDEDLIRRDFTINAIAYNPLTHDCIDIAGGIDDLEQGILKFVGCTKTRIQEDNLRYIRLLRFKSKYGFTIDSDEMIVAKETFDSSTLSMERIYDEFNKILSLSISSYEKTLIYDALENKLHLDFLFHSVETSNKILHDILTLGDLYPLVYYNGYIPDLKLPGYYKQLNTSLNHIGAWGKNINIKDLKKILAQTKKNLELAKNVLKIHGFYSKFDSTEYINKLIQIYSSGVPIIISDLKVNGIDLLEIGLKGPNVGQTLNNLLDYVYEYPEHNDKNILIDRVKKYK